MTESIKADNVPSYLQGHAITDVYEEDEAAHETTDDYNPPSHGRR